MSSHREAPEISKDPVADNTDVYAFVSPDRPDTVTLIANFIPFQNPTAARTSTSSATTSLYEIHVSNKGDARPDIIYQFQLHTPRSATRRRSSTTPGRSARSTTPTWNRPQFYSVTRVERAARRRGAGRATSPCPPVNVGPRSTPNYADLAPARRCTRSAGGRRSSPASGPTRFHVDLGSIFDLGTLRPFQNLHLIPSADGGRGQRRCRAFNVHTHRAAGADHATSPATATARPTLDAAASVIGVWAVGQPAEVPDVRQRRTGRVRRPRSVAAGLAAGQPAVQRGHRPDGREGPVERRRPARATRTFAKYVNHPELAGLLPVLYPGVFPNLAAYTQAAGRPARDPAHRHPEGRRARVPELHRPARRPTCCGSTWRSRRPRSPNPIGPGRRRRRRLPQRPPARSTTSWRSSCAPSPAPPSRWSTRPSPRTARRRRTDRRHDQHQRAVPRRLPLPRPSGWGLPDDARDPRGVEPSWRRPRTTRGVAATTLATPRGEQRPASTHQQGGRHGR